MTSTPLDMLRHRAETRPDDVAFIAGEDVWTYERLAHEVGRLARGLAGQGLQPGDRVVLHMLNRPETVVTYYACFLVGAIAVPLKTVLKTAELAAMLQRLQPALYIGDAELYPRIAAIDPPVLAPDRCFATGPGAGTGPARPWTDLLAADPGQPVPDAIDVHAPAALLTTSGTTGQPKLVIHTHATLGAVTEVMPHWGLDGSHVAILSTSMAHGSGLFTLVAYIGYGVPFILIERFDADLVLDAVERHRGTWLLVMPYMFHALLERQLEQPRDVASLRSCITGGDVCPRRLQDQFPFVFGCALRSIWAASETCGPMTWGLEPGPVCRLVEGAQVRLVGDLGQPVKQGEAGELMVRGPHVSIGYWGGPGVVEGAPRDGWYRTGDLMRQDDKGQFWFVSRKKEMIIRGGANISPVEIEEAMVAHPAVRAAAAVGIPDAVLGQRVAGFVELNPGAPRSAVDEVLADLALRLADYKVPEWLEAVDELPRNALGKLDRRQLETMTVRLKGAARSLQGAA